MRLSPPYLFGGALLTGLTVGQFARTPVLASLHGGWRASVVLAGSVIALVGAVLVASMLWVFSRTSQRVRFRMRPSRLIVAGPYQWSRNPDYLGQFMIALGIAIVLASPPALLACVLAFFVVDRTIVRREEQELASHFPDAYRHYCARVRRWL